METSHNQPIDNADYTPFVNEECGDTLWDDVLNQESAKPQNYASLAFTEPVKAVQEEPQPNSL
ncbi:hypothetical protein [Runella sp.]|uniref:hypothetical protein n=1 Tax=Runella sp. TaxID=1960881 RepID=UPI00301B57B5